MSKYYSSTLQKGSKGNEVSEWQKFLNSQGYNLTVDGDFGDNTHKATLEWQTKNGLGADGIVGENTWGKAGYTPYSTLTTPTSVPKTDTTSYGDTAAGQAALGDYNDAKAAVDSHKGYEFTEYTKGEDVLAAEDNLNTHLANKPGEYNSQWQSQLDALMNSILNRDKFSYDLNGDALYQQYKDKYIQQAKMAMGDAIGQASAMTGGYGNSYAQSVGQQAYQGQLDNLNDIVPELYQMALDKYNMEGQDLYNQYGLVMDRENLDYGRYRDSVADYLTERDYLTGRVDSALNFDYGKHMDTESMKQSMSQDEYAKLMDALGIAQGDLYHGEEIFYTDQSNKNNAAWMEYEAAEDARRYAEEIAYRDERDAIEDKRYEASISSSGGSGGGGGAGGNPAYNADGTPKEGYTTTNTSYFDEDGNFKKATFSHTDSNNNAVWYIDGKQIVRQPGANPYTGQIHKDAMSKDEHGNLVYDKSKVFPNTPYQPNNVNGQKLSKYTENGLPVQDYMNGVKQNIWKTPDGTLWIWDGTQNKYLKYGDAPKQNSTKTTYTSNAGGGGSKNIVVAVK
jgi:hypothetical protein